MGWARDVSGMTWPGHCLGWAGQGKERFWNKHGRDGMCMCWAGNDLCMIWAVLSMV